jgi:hypothetical protein
MAFLEYRVSSSESENSLFLSVLCVIVIILVVVDQCPRCGWFIL